MIVEQSWHKGAYDKTGPTKSLVGGWWLVRRQRAGTHEEQVVSIRISTAPRRAEIKVDGVLVHSQPLWLQRSSRVYNVEVRAPGYHPKVLSFRPERSTTLRVVLAAKRGKRGR